MTPLLITASINGLFNGLRKIYFRSFEYPSIFLRVTKKRGVQTKREKIIYFGKDLAGCTKNGLWLKTRIMTFVSGKVTSRHERLNYGYIFLLSHTDPAI